MKKITYKVSRYNHIQQKDDLNYSVYNARTNSLAVVPYEIGAILLDKDCNKKLQEIIAHDGLKTKLIKGGFIVRSDKDEVADALRIIKNSRKESSWLGMTIAPTMNCNFSCPYCFEPKEKMLAMSDETATKVVDFIASKLEGRTNLTITWYGGEPTLALNRIEQITAKIDQLINDRNITLYSEIITNGYNLNEKIINRLKACHVRRFQITLDGPPEIHNKRRAPKQGSSSFRRIVDNIKLLMKEFRVDIRTNIDQNNVEYADELITILGQEKLLDYCTISFSHVDALTSSSANYQDNCLSQSEFASKVRDIYIRNSSVLQHSLYPENPHTCAALGPNSYVVDPQGYLYRCWTAICDKNEIVGSVYAPADIEFKDTMTAFSIESSNLCKECDILPICLGGCPFKFMALKEQGRCIKWKFMLKDTIKDFICRWEIHERERVKC